MSGCFLNIILDPIFIMPWGLGMGAAGAGCATFISNCVACLYFLVYVLIKRGRSYVSLSPAMALQGRKVALDILAVGIPAMVQNLLNVTGMTILNNFTASYGSEAVAAMGIASKVQMVFMYVSMGISNGIMPLVGYNYADENVKRMKEAMAFTAKLILITLSIATLGCYIFSDQLVGLFIENAHVIELGSAFLRGLILSLPFMAVDFLGVGMYQACGMGKMSLAFAVMRKIVLEIPALFVLNALFPMYGLAYAQPFAEFVLAFAAVAVMLKIFRDMEKKERRA